MLLEWLRARELLLGRELPGRDEQHLAKVLLQVDAELREVPIAFKVADHHKSPDRFRFAIKEWTPLTRRDARAIARRAKGRPSALATELVAHWNGRRPDQVRGVLDKARDVIASSDC
jgi:hypothetical protein